LERILAGLSIVEPGGLIMRLGSSDDARIESGRRGLLRLGERALPALRKAVADETDEDTAARLRRMIERLEQK
jgi:hypothetical protein